MTDVYAEQKKQAFERFVGSKVLTGDWGDETRKSLSLKYDFDLLREFFDAGWDFEARMTREATAQG